MNGITRERPFKLAIGTFILSYMVYCLVNFVQTVTMGEEYTIKLVRLVLVLVFGSVIIIAASFYARVYHKSKNFIFRIVSANVSLQSPDSMEFTDTKPMRRLSESSETEDDEEPVTFESLGVPRPPSQSVPTSFGKAIDDERRPLSGLSVGEWTFAAISIVSILGALGLTVERLITTIQTDESWNSADVTYEMVLLVSIVFCLLYVVNGIIGERPFELAIFILATVLLMIYCSVNYFHSASGKEALPHKEYIIKLVRLVLIIAAGPISIGLAIYYAQEYHLSKNSIFRIVGANAELQDLCSQFFLAESLLKIDFQLQITLVILVLKNGFSTIGNFEIIVLSVGGVFSIAWSVLGYLSISRENKVLVLVVLVTAILEPAYIIYKIVDVGFDWDKTQAMISAGIIVAGLLGLVIRGLLCAFLDNVYQNFGRGMREKAYGVPKVEVEEGKDKAPKASERTDQA